MMGATHGLAGLAAGAGLVLALRGVGIDVDAGPAAVCITAAAVAAELADLDLKTSRISHGSSSLTAIPGARFLAILATLPVVLAGVLIRRTGVKHRGVTHSPAAAVLWSLLAVPLFAAYFWMLGGLVRLDAGPAPLLVGFANLVSSIAGAWLGHAPLIAGAVLAGYLTHLQLDDMTGAGQRLAWPFSTKSVSSPLLSIPVGRWCEVLLVTAPLAVVMLVAIGHVSEPAVQFGPTEPGGEFVACLLTPSSCDLCPPALSLDEQRTHGR